MGKIIGGFLGLLRLDAIWNVFRLPDQLFKLLIYIGFKANYQTGEAYIGSKIYMDECNSTRGKFRSGLKQLEKREYIAYRGGPKGTTVKLVKRSLSVFMLDLKKKVSKETEPRKVKSKESDLPKAADIWMEKRPKEFKPNYPDKEDLATPEQTAQGFKDVRAALNKKVHKDDETK
jgi:hypothetical protein